MASNGKTPGKFITDVWRVPAETLPPAKRTGVRLIRFIWCFVRGFLRNQCTQQASALTYITLMSIVPVLAVGFSVAKGFGADTKLKDALQANMDTIPEGAIAIINRLLEAVDKVNFATLGTIGLALLFWTVVNTMTQVENSFNRIWGVTVPRTWARRFESYLSTVICVPVLMLVATSITGAVRTPAVHDFLTANLGVFYPVARVCISLLGMSSVVIALSLLYMFMPNTKVEIKSAFAGGVVAGTAWYATQAAFVAFQIGVAKNNEIYGALAAVPFFLLWVYAGWVIVLAGAQFCQVFQNRYHLRFIVEPPPLSFKGRRQLGLVMMEEICASVLADEGAWDSIAFAGKHKLPAAMLKGVLMSLVRGGLITETAVPGAFLPTRDIHTLTPADVERAFREDVPDNKSPVVLDLPDSPATTAYAAEKTADFHNAMAQTSFADLIRKNAKKA